MGESAKVCFAKYILILIAQIGYHRMSEQSPETWISNGGSGCPLGRTRALIGCRVPWGVHSGADHQTRAHCLKQASISVVGAILLAQKEEDAPAELECDAW